MTHFDFFDEPLAVGDYVYYHEKILKITKLLKVKSDSSPMVKIEPISTSLWMGSKAVYSTQTVKLEPARVTAYLLKHDLGV